MVKFAVISDIHANIFALEAVLADIDRAGVTDIVCLGDALYGPMYPMETYEALMSRDILHVRGNSDRGMLPEPDDKTSTKFIVRGLVTKTQLDWIESLPMTCSLDSFLLCHGTPQADNIYLLYESGPDGVRERSDDELADMLAGAPESYVLCGHSHLPKTRLVPSCGKAIINVGSVGLPGYLDKKPFPHKMETGNNFAKYAIVEKLPSGLAVRHIELEYDFEKAAARAESLGRGDWAHRIRSGRG